MKNLFAIFKKISCKKTVAYGFAIMTALNAPHALAIENQQDQERLTPSKQGKIVQLITSKLTQEYVFPEKAKEIALKLNQLQSSGHFNKFISSSEFSSELTKQLQTLSQDKHIQVEFNPEPLPLKQTEEMIKSREAEELAMWRAHNFGFEKIERLPFNIGYLQLTAFGPTKEVGPLLASAMNLLANTDSLIIDLRGNFGGEEQTVSLLASYFLEKRTHLLNMFKRKNNVIDQHWSHEYVEGVRYNSAKNVYLLIDKDTFSAAEDFSYTMKHLTSATLIGEQTGGAANSGDFVQLTPYFSMFLPSGRGVNPVTQTNWEGTGVTPDIHVTSEQALNIAQKVILEKILAKETHEGRKKRLNTRISAL